MQRKTMQLTIRVDEALDAALRRAAEAEGRSMGDVARRVLAHAFSSGVVVPRERQVEYRGGESRVERDEFQDTSADELLGGPPTAAEWEEKLAAESGVNSVMRGDAKPQRLAAARAALEQAAPRRGFVTKELPSGKVLQVRVPGESRVEYDHEAVRASRRAGDDTGRG